MNGFVNVDKVLKKEQSEEAQRYLLKIRKRFIVVIDIIQEGKYKLDLRVF